MFELFHRYSTIIWSSEGCNFMSWNVEFVSWLENVFYIRPIFQSGFLKHNIVYCETLGIQRNSCSWHFEWKIFIWKYFTVKFPRDLAKNWIVFGVILGMEFSLTSQTIIIVRVFYKRSPTPTDYPQTGHANRLHADKQILAN